MRAPAVIVCLTLAAMIPGAAGSQQADVLVVGALGALHDREEDFGFATLDSIVRVFKPDVVLLEVTPEELAARSDTRGRPEYPKVFWPLLAEPGAPAAFAMEAGQPLYGELTGQGAALLNGFAAERPADNAALTAYLDAMTEVLLAYWQSPAQTQDSVTDVVARARHELRAALLPAGAVLQKRWDGVLLDVATKVIREHPGKRVLVMGSFRNRFTFVDELGSLPGVKLVDTSAWLRERVRPHGAAPRCARRRRERGPAAPSVPGRSVERARCWSVQPHLQHGRQP